MHTHQPAPPTLSFPYLETLWLQVTGTLCNLTCKHCFITCGPNNASHPIMTSEQVTQAVDEAVGFGVREFYFTGGEPFLHPEIEELIAYVLERGPLSILTNGLLIDATRADRLAKLAAASPYSLDLRVSLDGFTADQNDPIRGRGTFEKIIGAVTRCAAAGIPPILTITEVVPATEATLPAFQQLLSNAGITRPRLKFLPPVRLGREARRDRGYQDEERLVDGDLLPDEVFSLACGTGRMVTAKGVYPCPILIEAKDARMSDRLADALTPIQLRHQACYSCHAEGLRCRT
ncbi:MAG: radical SAM protein [Deltaproteobacteria bacterium]|nr:radical SAM protein [Deltaproteobacteria bacterium]